MGQANQVRRSALKAATVSKVILGGAGVVCILIVSYFLCYYTLTGDRYFVSYWGIVVFEIIPFLAAICFFVSLRLQPHRRVNLALIVFSAATTIFTVEFVIDLLSRLPSVLEYESQQERRRILKQAFGDNFDKRKKLDVVIDLRRTGIDAYPSVNPFDFLSEQQAGAMKLSPLGGISGKKTVVCNENGFYLTYDSDAYGFNNPSEVWNGRVQIAAVGDSYTQGFCVRPDESFVALIRAHYPATLNVGMAGDGPLLMLATLKEYVRLVQPSVVLWFYYEGNDLADLKAERKYPFLLHYLSKDFNQNLIKRQAEIDRSVIAYIKDRTSTTSRIERYSQEVENLFSHRASIRSLAWDTLALAQVRQRAGLVFGADTYTKPTLAAEGEEELGSFREVLREARDSVREYGGTLYFVYLPAYWRYVKTDWEKGVHTRIIALIKQIGLPIIDLAPKFEADPDALSFFPFRRFGHYNEKGHRLVAEQVLKSIDLNH